ncbi:MAG: histidine phosphatase family protein [Ignavibacterium sp.]|nr:histidine phosphatase family protein [Ignavibacterium sp.]
MKNLFLIRHAKSSWKEPHLPDFERPLNKRGKESLKIMSKFFSEKYPKPDLILSSPAERAKVTAISFAEKLNYKVEKIIFLEELYMADSSDIAKIISQQNEDSTSIALFGHNPGLTDFVNLYSKSVLENIPTCGIVHLRMENNWKSLKHRSLSMIDFFYPKMFGEFKD